MDSSGRVAKRCAIISSHLSDLSSQAVSSPFELESCHGVNSSAGFSGPRFDNRVLFGRPSSENGPLFARCRSTPIKPEVPGEDKQGTLSSQRCICKPADVQTGQRVSQDLHLQPQDSPPLFAKPVGEKCPLCSSLSDCLRPSQVDDSVDSRPLFARQAANSAPKKSSKTVLVPRMDVVESTTLYYVTVDLPGVSPKSVRVEINGRRLVVIGERAKKNGSGEDIYLQGEKGPGLYRAIWELPEDALASGRSAKAHLRDGVLCISLPKRPQGNA